MKPDDGSPSSPAGRDRPAHLDPGTRRPETELRPGTSLGRYLVLYRVGSGGVGEVYAAYDPELDRKVAIKVLRSGAERARARKLQRREAKAMARLRHPNVVAVYDVGEYDERTFIAMEFVDGTTLREWLAARPHRPWTEIVRLYLQAGRGLAAVHEAGLVHQDFKPANVMVTPQGQVLLTDFGLVSVAPAEPQEAAEAEEMLASATWDESSFSGGFVGTPAYLAPERLDGAEPDARSDQYSFCVALYQALYREHPFPALHLESYREKVERQEIPPPPPRTRVPSWLRKILLRGLSARLDQRFPTMEALLAALDPRRRRARRNVGLGAAVTLAVALGAGLLLSHARVTPTCAEPGQRLAGVWDEGRKGAVREAFVEANPALGEDAFLRVETALDGYAREWTAMHREACEATYVRREQSEHMLDLRMACLDGRREELRALTDVFTRPDSKVLIAARPSVDRLGSVRACADRAALDAVTPLPESEAARAELERIQAVVEKNYAFMNTDLVADVQELEASVEAARSLHYPPLESRALYVLGLVRIHQESDNAAAVDTFEEALWAAIAGGDRTAEAKIYAQLMQVHSFYRQDSERARWWRRFTEAALESLGPGEEETEFLLRSALGFMALNEGEPQASQAYLERALEIGKELWGADDARLAPAWNDLGLAVLDLEDYDHGVEYLRKAMKLKEQSLGPDNPGLARSLHNLAYYEAIRGHYDEARRLLERVLAILEGFYGPRHWGTAIPRVLMANVYAAMDRPEDATRYLETAIPVLRESLGEENETLAAAYDAQGEVSLLLDDGAAARRYFEKARKILEISLKETHPDRVAGLVSRGRGELERRSFGAARTLLEQARKLAETVRVFPRDRLLLETSLGRAYLGLGRPGEARPHLEQALAVGRPEADAALVAEARFALARALADEEPGRAVELARQALGGLSPEGSPRTRRLRGEVEAWLEKHPSPPPPPNELGLD